MNFNRLAWCLGLAPVLAFAGEKSLSVTTSPPGATVEIDGRIACPATPCSVSFPDYYFRKHFTFWSQRLTHPVQFTLRKDGYQVKRVSVTEGPKRWQAWNTPDYFDYYNITQREVSVTLEQIRALGATKTVAAQDLFVWFDEGPPSEGTTFLEVVISARAYDSVLSVLRRVRGKNTSVQYGESILDANYHPATFRLGDWLAAQPDPNTIPSVFYWEDEVLSDTTPVMSFYMTKRAYQSTLDILGAYMAGSGSQGITNTPQSSSVSVTNVEPSQPTSSPAPAQGPPSFWSTLARAAYGALGGMANYYAYVRPIEDQRIASQRTTAALNAQTFELQKLNNSLSQIQTQMVLRDLQQQTSEYSRMLSRYQTGRWP